MNLNTDSRATEPGPEHPYPPAPLPDEPYEGDQWYFRVHLDQPLGDTGDGVARDLAAFYPSEEEAESARMQLAGRVNDFYKNQFVNSMFGGKLH